ncbi:Uncharacterised protein [Brucella neotomae]|nr:Uncharacterised protein [Brucella neotomae]
MRRDDQPVDLLVRGVGDGKCCPVAGGVGVLVGLYLDTPHDAVRAGHGGNLHALALVAQKLDSARKVQRRVFLGNLDGLNGRCVNRRKGQENEQCEKARACFKTVF